MSWINVGCGPHQTGYDNGETFRALTAVLAPGFAAFILAAPAQAAFSSRYQQISSNTVACPTCSLAIADNPKIQRHFAEANNGWRAALRWTHGDSSTAAGSGRWTPGVGHAWRGRKFGIDLSQQGRMLSMTMSAIGSPNLGVIRAKFGCLDPSQGGEAICPA